MPKTRINISLDQDIADFAKIFAAQNRITVSDLMTQYLLSLKRKVEERETEIILADPAFQSAMQDVVRRLQDGTAKWHSYDEIFGE
jgi:hypothetical protein